MSDLARGDRQGIFGYAATPLPHETLDHIFLYVKEFMRDQWDQELKTEQEMVYLGLRLSHVCRQWRHVALSMRSLWSSIWICQSEQLERSTVTLPNSTQHFLCLSSPLLLCLIVSAKNYHILQCLDLPAARLRSLVIYGTVKAIYHASGQWTTRFPKLEELVVEVFPLPLLCDRAEPIVHYEFFSFFPSMTWLTLRNVDCIHFQHIFALRRLTRTIDHQLQLKSTSFLPLDQRMGKQTNDRKIRHSRSHTALFGRITCISYTRSTYARDSDTSANGTWIFWRILPHTQHTGAVRLPMWRRTPNA